MTQRPDLDLSSLIGYYDHINWGDNRANPWIEESMTPRTMGEPVAIQEGKETPMVASTDRSLVKNLGFSWDVNGWYRLLGVPFPYVNATPGAISQSYVALGGQSSPRMTYVLKRLLNRSVRAEYDMMPLGMEYLDDEQVQARMREQIRAEQLRRAALGEEITSDQVAQEMGYDWEPLDTDSGGPHTGRSSIRQPTVTGWFYGYWLWKVSRYELHDFEDRLQEWQSLLIREINSKGHRGRIGVGVIGGGSQYGIRKTGDYWVAFLGENQVPTEALAELAVAKLVADIRLTLKQ